jgi:hypothetical protein
MTDLECMRPPPAFERVAGLTPGYESCQKDVGCAAKRRPVGAVLSDWRKSLGSLRERHQVSIMDSRTSARRTPPPPEDRRRLCPPRTALPYQGQYSFQPPGSRPWFGATCWELDVLPVPQPVSTASYSVIVLHPGRTTVPERHLWQTFQRLLSRPWSASCSRCLLLSSGDSGFNGFCIGHGPASLDKGTVGKGFHSGFNGLCLGHGPRLFAS